MPRSLSADSPPTRPSTVASTSFAPPVLAVPAARSAVSRTGRGEIEDHVDPGAAVVVVRAAVVEELIVAGTALERVRRRGAEQLVAPRPAAGAFDVHQRVVPVSRVLGAGGPQVHVDRPGRVLPARDVRVVAAVQRVVARAAVDHVVARSAVDRVVAGATLDDVVARITIELGAAGDDVGAGPAIDDRVAGAGHGVVAIACLDRGGRAGGDRVVAVAGVDATADRAAERPAAGRRESVGAGPVARQPHRAHVRVGDVGLPAAVEVDPRGAGDLEVAERVAVEPELIPG